MGLYPELCTRDSAGNLKLYSHHYNLYIRDRKCLYPGESHDFWVNFTSAESLDSYRIPPGEYSIAFRAYYRCYKAGSTGQHVGGRLDVRRPDADHAGDPAPPGAGGAAEGHAHRRRRPGQLTRYIHTLEEFMTAFDCWQSAAGWGTRGVWHASCTSGAVDDPDRHQADRYVPVQCRTHAFEVVTDNTHLTVRPKLNPGNCMITDGKREPVIYSQLMSDMRANIQVSPGQSSTSSRTSAACASAA